MIKADLKIKNTGRRGGWGSRLVLSNKQGIYIFKLGNKVLYVGRSKNLYVRICSHLSNGGISNAFIWDTIEIFFTDNHKKIEKELICELTPIYNGNITSGIYNRHK